MKAFQSEIENKSVLRWLNRAEVSHELSGRFCNKSAFFSETLGIYNAVVAVIGSAKSGEFTARLPVEIARINDYSADLQCMSVHIFGGRMNNYIRPELKRTAVNRGGKGIIDY